MASNKAGRPVKPNQNKRQKLHVSLYAEDLERLDYLTNNRSEFLRQCIAKAWEEHVEGEATMSVTMPKSLMRELRRLVDQLEPHHEGSPYHRLAAHLKE